MRRKYKKDFSFNHLNILLSSIIIALSLIFLIFLSIKIKNQYLNEHITTQVKTVKHFSNFLEAKLISSFDYLELIKNNPKSNFSKEYKSFFTSIFLVNIESSQIEKVIFSSYSENLLKGIDLSYILSLPLTKFKLNKNYFFTPIIDSPFSDFKTIYFITEIDKFLLVAEINFSKLAKSIFEEFLKDSNDIIVITDIKNNFIVSSHKNFYFHEKLNLKELKFNNKIYTVVYTNFDLLNFKIFYFSPISTTIFKFLKIITGFIGVILILILILYFFLTKEFIIKPLIKVSEELNDYPRRPIKTAINIREIRTIKKKFNSARMIIINQMEKQKKLLKFLENLFNSIPFPIIIIDNRMKIRYCNQKANENNITKNDIKKYLKEEIFKVFQSLKTFNIYSKNINGKVFDIILYPLVNENQIACVFIDQTEKVFLEKKLMENQRYETISLLASGFFHDFSNIFQTISFTAELLKSNIENPEKLKTYINKLNSTCNTAFEIMKNIKSQINTGLRGENEIIDLKDVVKNTLIIVKIYMPLNIKIEEKFNKNESFPVYCNMFSLIQVLMNLIINARDAIIEKKEKQGLIEIILEKDEKNVYLKIKDNGIGIEEHNIKDIFEIGYTTKKEHDIIGDIKGTGIGLALVKQLIENCKGKISVKSELGKGTVFIITFPFYL